MRICLRELKIVGVAAEIRKGKQKTMRHSALSRTPLGE
jgi:hypothetical protein